MLLHCWRDCLCDWRRWLLIWSLSQLLPLKCRCLLLFDLGKRFCSRDEFHLLKNNHSHAIGYTHCFNWAISRPNWGKYQIIRLIQVKLVYFAKCDLNYQNTYCCSIHDHHSIALMDLLCCNSLWTSYIDSYILSPTLEPYI